MILHIINKTSVIDQCLAHIIDGDSMLFIENAAEISTAKTALQLLKPGANISIYVLADTSSEISCTEKNIAIIHNDKFVSLSCEAEKVVSWY